MGAAKDHGKYFQSELAACFSSIVYFSDNKLSNVQNPLTVQSLPAAPLIAEEMI